MAKQRLFPEPPKPSDEDAHTNQQRFSDLAGKVFSVPKSEIDKREKQWRRHRKRSASSG